MRCSQISASGRALREFSKLCCNLVATVWDCQHGHTQTHSQFLLWRTRCVSSSDSPSTCFTGIELGFLAHTNRPLQQSHPVLPVSQPMSARWLCLETLPSETSHTPLPTLRPGGAPSSYTSNFHRKVSVRSTTSSTDQVSPPWISMPQLSTVSHKSAHSYFSLSQRRLQLVLNSALRPHMYDCDSV